MNVALLASGKGSNVDNLLSYFSENQKVNIVLVGSNNNESGALKHALNHKVSTFIFSKKDLDNSNILLETLENNQIELLVLAGFMLKIPSGFIKSFNGSIVNVHPSLLPKYGGKGMYGDHVHRKVLENTRRILEREILVHERRMRLIRTAVSKITAPFDAGHHPCH